ncbi:NAD-dependent epimerase/dehydratase family protein [Agromyces bauzanensis]
MRASADSCSLIDGRPAARRPVFEDGRQRRDFVHVTDVARANLAAIDRLPAGPPGSLRACNVGSGTATTIGEIAARLARIMGGPAPAVRR